MFSVLYVDDEPALLEICKTFLELSGNFQIDTAESATAGIKRLEEREFHGIISDYLMPDMDGITFLKYVRSHWADLPFILFTGKGREDVVIEALNSGADFYLQKGGKPKAQFAELEYKIRLAIERRETAKALKVSQHDLNNTNIRLQGIVHGSPIPQFVIDRDHKVISWNEALEEYSSVKAKDVLETTDTWKAFYETKRPVMADLLVDGIPDKIPEWYAGKFHESKYVNGAFEATDFFPNMGSEGKWLYFTASAIRDPDHTIIGAVETLEDVTETKKKEAALNKSQEYLSKIINTLADPVFVKDRSHRWILLNDACCQFMGSQREDLLGKSDYDFFPESEAEVFWQKDEVVFTSGGENVNEEQFTDAQGITHTIITKKSLYTDQSGEMFIVGVIRDMTDIKREQAEVQKSREMFFKIFQTIPDAVTITRACDGTLLEANDTFYQIMGYTPEEVIGKPATALNNYADIAERDKLVKGIMDMGVVRYLEIRFRRKNGEIFTAEMFARSIEIGGESCIIAVSRDITEYKKAEDALKQSEMKLRAILDHSFQFIGLMTPDGTLIDSNRTALEFSGIKEADVIGRPFWKTPWWTHSPDLQDKLKDAVKQAAEGDFIRFEATHMDADGKIHFIDFSLKPVRDSNGNVVFLIPEGRDITDLKMAEGKIHREDKQ